MLRCDNCGKQYEREDQLTVGWPDIPGLAERLDVGGIVPAGECVDCGALVYEERAPIRLLVLLDGGLVRGVLAAQQGVEVVVLDQDLDGADETDMVVVEGEVDTLRGTLQAHEVTVAPTLIDSAYRAIEQVSAVLTS